MSRQRVLFVINRFSGSGYRKNLEGEIIASCEKREIEAQIEFTKETGHATALTQAAVAEGFSMVFAVGGDGTVNEVAKGLLNTGVVMGIIPKGSGNGLARHLQIPLQIKRALELIDRSMVIDMDTMTVNDHLSVNVSGIGFDGYIAHKFGKNGRRGLINYGKLVTANFVKFKEFSFQLSLDNREVAGDAFIISIANSSQFGNNASIAPSASVCDQLLDISIVKKMGVLKGLKFATQLFNRSIEKSPLVSILKTRETVIRLTSEQPYHVDGEPAGSATSFRIAVNPSSLKISIPAYNTTP